MLDRILFQGLIPELSIFYIIVNNCLPALPRAKIYKKKDDEREDLGEVDILVVRGNTSMVLIEVTVSDNESEIQNKCNKLRKLIEFFNKERGIETSAFLFHGCEINPSLTNQDDSNIILMPILDFLKVCHHLRFT